MARIIYRRNRIDPAKISGPYSLLAVMLLVAEILFAIWFYRAENSTERSVAGSVLAVVFVSLMLIVMRMNRTPEKEKSNGSITPGNEKIKSKMKDSRIAAAILSYFA